MIWFRNTSFLFLIIQLLIGQALPATSMQMEDSLSKMTLSHVTIGLDYRHSNGNYIINLNSINKPYYSNSYGIVARMQSSFIANYLTKQRRFIIGDVLAGEVGSIFMETSNPDIKNNLGFTYRFEFGLGTIFRINKKQDVGLNLIILKFARDRVSPNISGSFVALRYRYRSVLLNVGIEARRDRIFGWIQALQPNFYMPMQYNFEISWLCRMQRLIGLRLEVMSDEQNNYLQNNMNTHQSITARIFYGINF